MKAPKLKAAITANHVDWSSPSPSVSKSKQQGQEEYLPWMKMSRPRMRDESSLNLQEEEFDYTWSGSVRGGSSAAVQAQAATPQVSAPLQWERTHAWVSRWQAQWKDSQSQSTDGGYSRLVTWDMEEIQKGTTWACQHSLLNDTGGWNSGELEVVIYIISQLRLKKTPPKSKVMQPHFRNGLWHVYGKKGRRNNQARPDFWRNAVKAERHRRATPTYTWGLQMVWCRNH